MKRLEEACSSERESRRKSRRKVLRKVPMAGVYGEINSKSDYQRVLREASSIVIRVLEGTPNSGIMQGVKKQLEAMKRWTDGGRKPSEIERRNIDVGVVAARELSEATGELSDLAQKLC